MSTTLRAAITRELGRRGETWDDIQHITLAANYQSWAHDDDEGPPAPDLDRRYDDGYGATNSDHFTAWTAHYVYFPECYDGAESVVSVPRHPCGEATKHVGGG